MLIPDLSRVAVIVPAGGAGSLTNGRPKILEEICPGRSIIGQVLQNLHDSGLKTLVVVVNNYLFQETIQSRLVEEGFADNVIYGLQHWRLGAADAVAVGIEKLDNRIDTVLVTYADMPLWRPETFLSLISLHQGTLAGLSMVSVALTEDQRTPEIIKRYGRILRGPNGCIKEIVEPSGSISSEVTSIASVNPSLYVLNRRWLQCNLCKIQPVHRGDSYPPEFHFPPLVRIAFETGTSVSEFRILDPKEALGVNNAQELAEVKRIFAERK